MRGTPARGRLAVLAACAMTLAGAVSVAQAQDGDLDGFTPSNADERRQVRGAVPAGGRLTTSGGWNRRSAVARTLVGTPNQARVLESALAKLRSYGLDAHTAVLRCLAARSEQHPGIDDEAVPALGDRRGKPMPWSEDFQDVVVGYNAYSPPGDVTGQVVYANYGLPADFAELDNWASRSRASVLVRYGQSFRGVKVHVAEQHGAKGMMYVLLPIPRTTASCAGPFIRRVPWRPADSIQRGSIQFIFGYPAIR